MLKPPCKTQSAHLIGMCIFFLSNFYLMYVYYFFFINPFEVSTANIYMNVYLYNVLLVIHESFVASHYFVFSFHYF